MPRAILPLILALCPALLGAVEERLTLKDGRVLVGTYDAERGMLKLSKAKASLAIAASQIERRETVEPTQQSVLGDQESMPEPKSEADRAVIAAKHAHWAKDRELGECLEALKVNVGRQDDDQKAVDAAWKAYVNSPGYVEEGTMTNRQAQADAVREARKKAYNTALEAKAAREKKVRALKERKTVLEAEVAVLKERLGEAEVARARRDGAAIAVGPAGAASAATGAPGR